MLWSASVLTPASADTEPTIIVAFDQAKYIFNAGENTNRAFLQSPISWKKTRGIFFTECGTQRMSGLAGLLMSFADATISNLDLVGPPGLMHYLAAMRLYTFRDAISVKPTEVPLLPAPTTHPAPVFSDERVTIYAIPINPSNDTPQPESNATISSQDVSMEPTLKRKRENSPYSPSKRPTARKGSEEPYQAPATLIGRAAEDWRNTVLQTMFPNTRARASSSTKKSSPVKKAQGQSPQKMAGSIPTKSSDAPGSRNRTPSPNPDEYRRPRMPRGFHEQLPEYTSSHPLKPGNKPTLAYVVVGPRVRGRFDVEKAKELGLVGSMRSRLTRGESVTVTVKQEDGSEVERVVTPEEVVGPVIPPSVVLIFDIPTRDHIPPLLEAFKTNPLYSRLHQQTTEDAKEYVVRTAFHTCGQGVLEDPAYIEFINGFGDDAQHIVSSKEHSTNPVTFTSAAYNLARLNKLDSEMFTVPKFSLEVPKDIKDIPNLPPKTCVMESNLTVSIRPVGEPFRKVDPLKPDRFHPMVIGQEVLDLPEDTARRFAEAKERISDTEKDGNIPVLSGADVAIIPLGTGSAMPTKYRNVSSTLIELPGGAGYILLDCGEGTWGQLSRQFGLDPSSPTNVWEVLRKIRCVFISHVHGDHHMGLAKLLAQRRQLATAPEHPLYLIALRSVQLYIRELSNIEDLGIGDGSARGIVTIMSEALNWQQPKEYPTSGLWQIGGNEPWLDLSASRAQEKKLCEATGLESIRTVGVRHRTRCFGVIIKHSEGWSVVFSGDTQPTYDLVAAGRGATLLLHEATMADDQEEMAERKAHSTAGQAITIGKQMNAKVTLLTHFSARYPKMPPAIAEGRDHSAPIVAVAFDHARMRIGDMWKLNHYLPALERNFSDTVEAGDEETEAVVVEGAMNVNVA